MGSTVKTPPASERVVGDIGDLYISYKNLQKQLEFLQVHVTSYYTFIFHVFHVLYLNASCTSIYIFNALAERVTVLGLSFRPSTRQPKSDTNEFSATLA